MEGMLSPTSKKFIGTAEVGNLQGYQGRNRYGALSGRKNFTKHRVIRDAGDHTAI